MHEETEPKAIMCLLDGARGIYIPQNFAQWCDPASWHISPNDVLILQAGPDHEDYWEAWDDVLREAYYDDERGHWTLEQDGDLFAVVYE